MFYGRQTNARIDDIPERALRAVYNDEISPFEEVLERDKSETMHQRNIKILAVELFKIKNDLSNNIMAQLIYRKKRLCYNLRSQTDFSLAKVKSASYGLKAFDILLQKYGIFFLVIIKTLEHFKNSKKKSWIPRNCPCRIKITFIK